MTDKDIVVFAIIVASGSLFFHAVVAFVELVTR